MAFFRSWSKNYNGAILVEDKQDRQTKNRRVRVRACQEASQIGAGLAEC